MSADDPTILATSGGIGPGTRTRFVFTPLTQYAVELAGVVGRPARVCFLATASGDNPAVITWLYEAAMLAGYHASHLTSFGMPNVPDPAAHLLEQDVVWVMGGSVAGLLAMWRLHGYDSALRSAWEAGVVLTGISAGSLCWHAGGTTDSFGPELRAVHDGLGLVPFANSVHHDVEAGRRPLFNSLVARGELPTGYATDDGVGLVYRGTALAEVVSEEDGKAAYRVEADGLGGVIETPLAPRRLG